MNKTEAVHVNTLLCWIFGKFEDAGPITVDDARYVATELAKKVNATIPSGLRPAEVDNAFLDQQPTTVPSPAYVLRLSPDEVRQHFAVDECDCQPHTPACRVCQLGDLTDDQLCWAAAKMIGRDNPLDEGLDAMHEAIVDLARYNS